MRGSISWLSGTEESGPERLLAFVFGTERSGLTNRQIQLCQRVAAIPANPDSPSLNLAQAVQVTAYEMHMQLLGPSRDAPLYGWQRRFEEEPAAGAAALEGFFEHWRAAMTACGALDPAEPKNLMNMSRRLFARAAPTQREIDLLRGICAAVILSKSERAGTKKAAAATIADRSPGCGEAGVDGRKKCLSE